MYHSIVAASVKCIQINVSVQSERVQGAKIELDATREYGNGKQWDKCERS